jgi:arabinofuranan 3-O-arabinosyltransferase
VRTRLLTIICALLAVAYLVAFATSAKGPEGQILDANGRPQLTDHLSLWAAGSLASEGRPAAAYDWAAHSAAMAAAMGRTPQGELQFSYPPSFLLVMDPLSRLPFAASFVLFGLLTLLPLGLIAARIVGRPDAALWALATLPPFWNLCVGQTGALAATLLAAGLMLLPSRPWLAGAMFGLLTFKPHLGVLVPIALLAAGQHRAILAAAATAIGIALASVAVHGIEPWQAFAASVSKFGGFAMADSNATAYKLQSLFGFLRALGLTADAAITAQIALSLALVALVWHIWRQLVPHDLKAAILLVGATLATPYVYHYDLIVLTLAMAFMLRHALAPAPARAEMIPAGDLVAFITVNALILAFPRLSFPTAFLGSVLLLILLLQRLRAHRLAPGGPSLPPSGAAAAPA